MYVGVGSDETYEGTPPLHMHCMHHRLYLRGIVVVFSISAGCDGKWGGKERVATFQLRTFIRAVLKRSLGPDLVGMRQSMALTN